MFGRKKAVDLDKELGAIAQDVSRQSQNNTEIQVKDFERWQQDASDFIPRNRRPPPSVDSALKTVKSFSELKTKEIDQVIQEVEAELNDLKERGQVLRNLFNAGTEEIEARAKTLRSMIAAADTSLKELERRCKEIYQGDKALPAPEEQEINGQDDGTNNAHRVELDRRD